MNKIIQFTKNNFKALLTSFLIALMLWVVVATNKTYRYQKNFNLRISTIAKGFVLLNPPPKQVRIEISGKGTSLIVLGFYDIVLDLNLPEINENHVIDLMDYRNRLNIPADLNIEIIEILEPKKIELQVDKYVEVKRLLELDGLLKTVPGYIYLSWQSSADSVNVSGPQSIISSIHRIKTVPFTKEDVRYPFTETIPVSNPNPAVLSITPAEVAVDFVIEQLVERNLYNIPIQFVGVPKDLVAAAVPPYVSVRVKGGESLVSQLSEDQLTILFNYAREYRQDVENYTMEIRTPPKIEVVETSPEKFRLHLTKKDR